MLREFEGGFGISQVMQAVQVVRALDDSFEEYFELFGRSSQALRTSDDATPLGVFAESEPPLLASFCLNRGAGAVYVIPFQSAVGLGPLLGSMISSVRAHRAGAGRAVPGFLGDLRLHGEADVLSDIATHETALESLRAEAERLESFRMIVGTLSGTALENLVIETLNHVLGGTVHAAEDRDDVRAEDFWIVGPSGDFALAEVKGQNTHIRRDDVNQVDSHREAIGRDADLPGLLIINIFRGHDSLEQRELPLSSEIVRRAASSNVLVLRTIDLYNLLDSKLAGEDAGEWLIESLSAGGGWLEVAGGAHTLHSS